MAIKRTICCFVILLSLTISGLVSSQDSNALFGLSGADFRTGEPVALSDFHGKVVYIDFWASWCGPCREILPELELLHKEYASRGVAIVAVNIDEFKVDAERFLEQYPISYAHLYDPKGQLAQPFKVRVMPTGILIDANGNVHNKHVGFKDGDIEKLEATLLELLGEASIYPAELRDTEKRSG